MPIDFGEKSCKAIDASLEMAVSASNVYVVHVAPNLNISPPEVVWQSLDEDVRRQSIEKSFHQEIGAEKYRHLRFHVLFGDPGHRIADYAEEIAASLIVISPHGRTGLKRLLIGSVAERVVRLAHCPVLVLRQ